MAIRLVVKTMVVGTYLVQFTNLGEIYVNRKRVYPV